MDLLQLLTRRPAKSVMEPDYVGETDSSQPVRGLLKALMERSVDVPAAAINQSMPAALVRALTGARMPVPSEQTPAAMGAGPGYEFGKSLPDTFMSALMLANPAASAAGRVGSGNEKGIFAGVSALTADKAALEKAKQFEKARFSPKAIWQETGWFKAPDGNWKFEIPDNAATYQPGKAFDQAKSQFDEMYKQAEDSALLANYMKREKVKVGDAKEWFRTTFRREPAPGAGLNAKDLDPEILNEALKRYESRKAPNPSEFSTSMVNVYEHRPLYDAYPELQWNRFKVQRPGEMGSAIGYYNNGTVALRDDIAYMLDQGKSTATHELQHGVQQIENFGRGGSPENAPKLYRGLAQKQQEEANQLINRARRNDPLQKEVEVLKPGLLKRAMELQEQARRNASAAEWATNAPMMQNELYRKLAGEAEARAVQSRLNLNQEQRKNIFPLDSYDVPIDELRTVDRGLIELLMRNGLPLKP